MPSTNKKVLNAHFYILVQIIMTFILFGIYRKWYSFRYFIFVYCNEGQKVSQLSILLTGEKICDIESNLQVDYKMRALSFILDKTSTIANTISI